MRIRAVLMASALVFATAPASAAEMNYGWCETESGPPNYLMSGLLQQPKGGSSDELKRAFQAGVQTDRGIECWFFYSSPGDARSHFEQRQYVIKTDEHRTVSLTGWTGPYGITGAVQPKPSGAFLTVEDRRQSPAQPEGLTTPARPKKSNAQADAEYAAAMAAYKKELADQQGRVSEYRTAEEQLARTRSDQRKKAEQAMEAYQEQLRAHEQAVRDQQLEYQKQASKPAGVANAVYRGFSANDCASARLSAVKGAGTTSGTQFREVTAQMTGSTCVVQGWWWDTSKGTATRQ